MPLCITELWGETGPKEEAIARLCSLPTFSGRRNPSVAVTAVEQSLITWTCVTYDISRLSGKCFLNSRLLWRFSHMFSASRWFDASRLRICSDERKRRELVRAEVKAERCRPIRANICKYLFQFEQSSHVQPSYD